MHTQGIIIALSFIAYNDECPYEGDIKCNSRCYRSYQFCDHYQRCISNTTTNCSEFIIKYVFMCVNVHSLCAFVRMNNA